MIKQHAIFILRLIFLIYLAISFSGCQNANIEVSGLNLKSSFVSVPAKAYNTVGSPLVTSTVVGGSTYTMMAKVSEEQTTVLINGSYQLMAQVAK